MSFLDKIIHNLDEQNSKAFIEDKYKDIKNNIKALLNTKLDDCLSINDLGIHTDLNLSANELSSNMAKEINYLISKYEKRIKIISINYDYSLSPWQLSFLLKCIDDEMKEINYEIIFKNNRYYEVF
ncbi:type VI secretion system baseplate subunit TssE [Campylobacter novaezeelandiae]|uniref:Type VI secretion system baseplate subunit TssE n=1 Tax=Campylobacter novaezeelandiae TaxID=2267891 RepID=A0A4Q9JSG0_9BACT|nr:GPW/gp25 family protein [Campylobacter novaezeelandiae]QWU80755.1 type VI secretion system, baseplate protein [Campylobacter novaezeelandiae]QWU80758.1 type VI secretion system, baseplate protein [Campylobacter novaezeelandiae]TBR78604.1 type VI secretion system baseplate subunit TssE [Campylobacter novaezeelandiae]TBR78631.1 type VI secretion system baseplate subunit TssE [Campylobacter novaezeelandiae]TBR78860.1 type VI secretion system baseplate subunit TssE [Campylobacter novaezeelandia